jgi:hypothetical protein
MPAGGRAAEMRLGADILTCSLPASEIMSDFRCRL